MLYTRCLCDLFLFGNRQQYSYEAAVASHSCTVECNSAKCAGCKIGKSKIRLKIFPLLLTSQQKVQECDATADAIKINSRAQKMLFFNVDNLNDK